MNEIVQQTTAPNTFPISIPIARTPLELFGTLDAAHLDTVSGLNGIKLSGPEITAPNYLLSLGEQPLLADELRLVRAETSDARPPQSIRAYRAGVCIGTAVLRNQARSEGRSALQAWPPVTPDRRYLALPHSLTPAKLATISHFPLEVEPERTNFYTEELATSGYFTNGLAFRRRSEILHRTWDADVLSILAEDHAQWQDIYGYVLNGLADTFRLRRMLEHEQQIAPTGSGRYDSRKHFAIDAEALPPDTAANLARAAALAAQDSALAPLIRQYRYPVYGLQTNEVAGTDEWRLGSGRLSVRDGSTRLAGEVVTSLRQFLVGLVTDDAGSLRPVGFADSLQEHHVHSHDRVVFHSVGYSYGRYLPDFHGVVDGVMPSGEVVGVRSGSHIQLVDTPAIYSDSNLGVIDSGLLDLLLSPNRSADL